METSPKRKRNSNDPGGDILGRSRARIASQATLYDVASSEGPGSMLEEDPFGIQEPEPVRPTPNVKGKGKAPAMNTSAVESSEQPPQYGNVFASAGSALPPKLSPPSQSILQCDGDAASFAGSPRNNRYMGGRITELPMPYSGPPSQIPLSTFAGLPTQAAPPSYDGDPSVPAPPKPPKAAGPPHVVEAMIRVPWAIGGGQAVPRANLGFRDAGGTLAITTMNHPLHAPHDLVAYCTRQFPNIKRLTLLITVLGDSAYSFEGTRQLAETIRLLIAFGPYDYEFHVKVGCERLVPEPRRRIVEAQAWAAFVEWIPSQGFWLLSIEDVAETWGKGPKFVYNTFLAQGRLIHAPGLTPDRPGGRTGPS